MQFVPYSKHSLSPLHRPTGQCCEGTVRCLLWKPCETH